MSASWENAYGACPPAAAEVLRVVSTLDLAVLSSPAAGVAAELTPDETATALADLSRDGWVVPAAGKHAVVERARAWLVRNHPAEPARAAGIIQRFAEYHLVALKQAGTWLAEHHAEVLAAVRACDRGGLRRLGTRLAEAAWPAAGRLGDPRELAQAGEALAVADRDPATLAGLLHHAAAAFAAHGDRLGAEERWVRALAIIRRDLKDIDQEAAVLTGLSALYRDWDRLGKALDADLRLVDLRRAAGDAIGTAEALATVAATMRAAGRLSSAADYLEQADAVFADGGSPEVHARVLVSWGRALWDQGQHTAAKRRWSAALAMAIDVDDNLAEHVRALLATAPEDPLPG